MLNFTIEQVDELMKQTGATYEEAKALLEQYQGDVHEATKAYHEKHQKFDAKGLDEVVAFIKRLFDEGLAARLIVRKNDDVVMNIPAGFSLLGLVKLPLTVAVLAGLLISGHKIIVEKKDGEIIDINDVAEKTATDVKKAGQGFYDSLQEVLDKHQEQDEDVVDELKVDLEDEIDKNNQN